MASRQIKMPVKDDSEKDVEDVFSQRKRSGTRTLFAPGRPANQGLLHDPQAAQTVALGIKTAYPIVQVSIYDSVDNTSTMVEVAAAAS